MMPVDEFVAADAACNGLGVYWTGVSGCWRTINAGENYHLLGHPKTARCFDRPLVPLYFGTLPKDDPVLIAVKD
jgi:hypothetical protein